jgi:hypothetical protein
MKHNKKRILNITNELSMNLFAVGATNISIQIQERETDFSIHIQSDYSIEKQDKVRQLVEALQSKPNAEVEEFYWELAGDSDVGNELCLICMMLDQIEVELVDNTIILDLLKSKDC